MPLGLLHPKLGLTPLNHSYSSSPITTLDVENEVYFSPFLFLIIFFLLGILCN